MPARASLDRSLVDWRAAKENWNILGFPGAAKRWTLACSITSIEGRPSVETKAISPHTLRHYAGSRTMPGKDRPNCRTGRVGRIPAMFSSASTRHSFLPRSLGTSPVFNGLRHFTATAVCQLCIPPVPQLLALAPLLPLSTAVWTAKSSQRLPGKNLKTMPGV